jgi:dTDP-4-amino-4,6-dideoxygalactose transaminase
MTLRIPLCDLSQQYLSLKDEIDAAMQSVAVAGSYILGPNVAALEREIATYCGCQYAVGVNSGTDALHLALRALDIGPGDEVITTPFTFIATTEAIGMVGAMPVFVDIDPRTFNIDTAQIEQAITRRTKALLPVHLYGQPCKMDAIVQIAGDHGLPIIEDCAQAIGAEYQGKRVGSFGKVGCFSFFPSKNLGCFGDGGMITTNDRTVFERVEMLRRHGGKVKYHHTHVGLNSRLDELQAAILRVKLKRLDEWNARRRSRAYRYNQLFESIPAVRRPAEIGRDSFVTPTATEPIGEIIKAVYHQYTVMVDDRSTIQAALDAARIGSAIYYPVPLHLQEVHRNLRLGSGSFPVAEDVSHRCLSLPMYPELDVRQQQAVVGAVAAADHCTAQPQCAA